MKIIYKGICCLFFLFLTIHVNAQEKPNIILIISDDAGYADFGFQGSKEFKTPNLDKLATQGIVFEQAYVTAAVCGPSRAGILTGRYQQRFGFEENNVPGIMENYNLPDDEMGLPLEEKTMANYMKSLGYRTALFGKWHQGNADQFHPTKRGFETFYGFRGGARSYYEYNEAHPTKKTEDFLEKGFKNYGETDEYLTYTFANAANDFIKKDDEAPFFIILSFNAVHSPMDALKEDLGQFPKLSGKRKKLAAMTLAMDKACGSVFETIESLGIEENTLIVFTNDNGGPTDSNASSNKPLSGTKANHLEGGIRVPFIMKYKGVLSEGERYTYPISTLDLLPTFYQLGKGDLNQLSNIDGVNLIPYLKGELNERPHQSLFWKKENRAAIRDGDWKLLRFPDRPAELYYLPNDQSEQNNLASKYPQKVQKLYKRLFEWELTLARPRWQLKRKYEGKAMERMDKYRLMEKEN
ncbi:sulfatase-like hydrolase/transferase [Sediminitomix flava]|uniref:Arylsulfatase A-like enzyme n=1 Tax=Sediminitomix flava TaxID=379075 RepID=A0A315Z5V5_SEDFL|nr:sulfatase-like hydrolase/transferase [Sediminitomix flava]PWJ37956.1 arylsulfatase A-like enzyme [Sediminitomix flava]